MSRVLAFALISGFITANVVGAPTVMATEPVQDEELSVLAAEDQWIQAEIERDEATLRRVIDEKFVFNRSNGQTSGKEDLIGMVRGWNMVGQKISERSVVVDGDTAVILGTTELRFASEGKGDHVQVLRYTATYIKRKGQWRAIALQMAGRDPR